MTTFSHVLSNAMCRIIAFGLTTLPVFAALWGIAVCGMLGFALQQTVICF